MSPRAEAYYPATTGNGERRRAPGTCSPKVLIFMGTLADATGGFLSNVPDYQPDSATSTLVTQVVESLPNQATSLARGKILLIRSALSLNLSDLASVLRVGRPTLYSWLEGTEPRDSNYKRVTEVYKLVETWLKLSSEPVGILIKENFDSPKSLLQQLVLQKLNTEEIAKLFSKIHAKKMEDSREKSRSYQSTRDLMKKFGFPEPTDDEKNKSLNLETR